MECSIANTKKPKERKKHTHFMTLAPYRPVYQGVQTI